MESWRTVWREGFAPLLSDKALACLADALGRDDARLVQEATTVPAPLSCTRNWRCEAACLIGYAGWQAEGLESVGEVEEFFGVACFDCDKRLGEPAGCRHLLNWFDETPRDEMRRLLLPEIHREISRRGELALSVIA